MGQKIRELMTGAPVALDVGATVSEAARQMKQRNVGDVLVTRDGKLCGIVTDRDLVVRCLAQDDGDSRRKTIGEFCTEELVTLAPDAEVTEAIRVMQDHAVRRIPIVDHDRAVGVVSLGDLAIERDRQSTLGEISAAPPNR
jgi:CBS domain-containing protein